MSRRPEAASVAPGRHSLAEVLAAGLSQAHISAPVAPFELGDEASVDARSKQTFLKTQFQKGSFKPAPGVTKPKAASKPKPKIDLTSLAESAETISYVQKLLILEDVYEYIDYYSITDGSLESAICLQSVGAIRYFEHIGLADPEEAGQFYHAVNIYLSYLQVKDAVSAPMATDANIFDDAQKAQLKRTVFNDVAYSELFRQYFEDIVNFCTAVFNGDWGAAKDKLLAVGPQLALISMQFLALPALGALPTGYGLGNDIIRRLDGWWETMRGWNVDYNWAGIGNRYTWAQGAIRWADGQRITGWLIGDATEAFLAMTRLDVSRALGIVMANEPVRIQSPLEGFLKQVWKVNAMVGPLGKIAFDVGLILTRATLKAVQFKIESVEQYVSLNTRADARLWRRQLEKAYDNKVGISAAQKTAKKREIEANYKKFATAHRPLKKVIRKKPRIVRLADESMIVTTARLMSKDLTEIVKDFAHKNYIWRKKVTPKLKELNASIEVFQKFEGEFDDKQIKEARKQVEADLARERRERIARGEAGDEPTTEDEEDAQAALLTDGEQV